MWFNGNYETHNRQKLYLKDIAISKLKNPNKII